jgi:hypothetical protein
MLLGGEVGGPASRSRSRVTTSVVVVVVVFACSLVRSLSLSMGFDLFLVRSLSLSARGVRSVGLVQYLYRSVLSVASRPGRLRWAASG